MEDKKLNLGAPFLSVRRVPTKLEDSNESKNTKKKMTTTTATQRRKAKDSSQETDHETLIRLLQNHSFNHLTEPSSVPSKWEQTPGKLEDHHHTPIEELDLIKALESVSSAASLSANCSTNGVSEFENNGDGDRSSNVSRDDVILEFRDLIMSRFLPAAEAIAMKKKKESSGVEEEKKKKHSIALQRVSMAINQDLNNDDDVDNDDGDDHNPVDGIDHTVCSNDFKKARLGYLPRFCSKNSLDVLNPVLSQVKICQDLGVKSEKLVNPKSQDSVYKTKSGPPRILRSNKVLSKYQEPRLLTVSLSKSGEIIQIPRNPSRLHSTNEIQSQETRFLEEEVKRRSKRNKIRSKNLSVSQPPLPKTPSESWLCRALPRNSAASAASSIVPGQATGFKKMEPKTNPQSIKWETIVKTSYKHNDHVRYSKELMVVHPSRQHKS